MNCSRRGCCASICHRGVEVGAITVRVNTARVVTCKAMTNVKDDDIEGNITLYSWN